jgi:hypothetical protein
MAESDMNKFSWQKPACVLSCTQAATKNSRNEKPRPDFLGGKGFQTGPGEEIAQIDAQEASGKSYHLVGGEHPEI